VSEGWTDHSQLEGAQAIFLDGFGRRLQNEGERGIWKPSPNSEVVGGDRQPAKRERVPAGFGNSPDLMPRDLMYFGIDHFAFRLRGRTDRARSRRKTSGKMIALAEKRQRQKGKRGPKPSFFDC
jgi:hypothetical protein